jgi:hypothetical protein
MRLEPLENQHNHASAWQPVFHLETNSSAGLFAATFTGQNQTELGRSARSAMHVDFQVKIAAKVYECIQFRSISSPCNCTISVATNTVYRSSYSM